MSDTDWTVNKESWADGHYSIDSEDHGALALVVVQMEDEPTPRPEWVSRAYKMAACRELYEALLQAMASIDPEDLETFRVCNAALAKARGES